MLTIRFSRVGKKNRAAFRLVLTENTAPVKGRFTELLGSYDPHSKTAVLKKDRILYWKEKGASFSPSVHNLLVKEGVLKEKKVAIKMEKKQPEKKEEKMEEKKESLPEEKTPDNQASAQTQAEPETPAEVSAEVPAAEEEPAQESVPAAEEPVEEKKSEEKPAE